jgi:hypothetical protein
MDRLVELVGQLEPDTVPPPPDAQARQRAALLQSMKAAGRARPGPARWRPRRGGWFLAIAGAAAAVVIGVAVVPGWLSTPRTSSHPPGVAPGTSAVLTAVTRALAGTSGDIEEVRSTVSAAGLGSTAWVDLATGACRTDTAVGGKPTLTVFVENGQAVIVDYSRRQWWSRDSEGVTCAPLTPQTIEQDLAAGRYSLAGHSVIDGRQALQLVSTTTTSGLHPVTKLTTLWVDATSYLPIQSISTGHLTETTVFAWLPATAANQAVLTVAVPAGFQHVGAPPPSRPSAP